MPDIVEWFFGHFDRSPDDFYDPVNFDPHYRVFWKGGDSGGSPLGLAHTLCQTGPFRPDHRSSAMEGLYYTGAYTRPGVGVPVCLVSGEHAAEAVIADH